MVITVTLSLDLELHNYFYYVNSLRGKLFSLSYRGSFGLENNK